MNANGKKKITQNKQKAFNTTYVCRNNIVKDNCSFCRRKHLENVLFILSLTQPLKKQQQKNYHHYEESKTASFFLALKAVRKMLRVTSDTLKNTHCQMSQTRGIWLLQLKHNNKANKLQTKAMFLLSSGILSAWISLMVWKLCSDNRKQNVLLQTINVAQSRSSLEF